jgi:hypothetical protein
LSVMRNENLRQNKFAAASHIAPTNPSLSDNGCSSRLSRGRSFVATSNSTNSVRDPIWPFAFQNATSSETSKRAGANSQANACPMD